MFAKTQIQPKFLMVYFLNLIAGGDGSCKITDTCFIFIFSPLFIHYNYCTIL
jgi:hypothetical protein